MKTLRACPTEKLYCYASLWGYLPIQYLHVYRRGAAINIEIVVIDMTNDKRANGKAMIPEALHLYYRCTYRYDYALVA
jgi:hypothetical protein